MSEYVYAERAPVKRRIASDGRSATFAEEKAAMPAARARTPEPTMFLARFAIEPTSGAPAGSGAPASAVSAEAEARTGVAAHRLEAAVNEGLAAAAGGVLPTGTKAPVEPSTSTRQTHGALWRSSMETATRGTVVGVGVANVEWRT